MNLRQEAVKGVAWSAAEKYGIRVISFVVTLILARLLLPESFGLVAYASVFLTLAGIFVDQGFADAIVQFPTVEREHLDTAFWINLLSGALFSILTFFAAGLIAKIFKEPELAPILKWLSPVFVIGALNSVQYSILRRKLGFKSLTLRSFISVFSSGLVAVVLAFLGYGVWSLVAKGLVAGTVSVIVLWQVSDWRPSFHFSWKHFKELFSYGIHIIGGNFVEFISVHSGDFLIGYFLGSTALGYYTMAYHLLLTLTDLLVTVPNKVVFPVFAKLQDDSARLKSAFYEVTQLQSIIAFPVFLGICSVAPEAVRVLYGDKWVASIPVMQVLMLIGVVRSAIYFYSSVFRSLGKPSWRFGIYSLTAALNVIGFFIAVKMGIVAVAISYVAVSYLVMPIYFLMIRKIIQVSIRSHLKQYSPAMVGSLIMVLGIYLLRFFIGQNFPVLIRLIILVLAGAGIYLLVLRLIRPSLFTKILDLAKMALPKSWRDKIERKLKAKNIGTQE